MYATREDLEARYSAQEITRLEGSPGGGTVANALTDATEQAQSYVSVRYTAPLPNVPAPLKIAACDIARFRLYKDRATEEVKYRYESAIKWLEQLAAGKVVLTFDPALTPEQVDTIVAPVSPYGVRDTLGVFGDATLARMPSIPTWPV